MERDNDKMNKNLHTVHIKIEILLPQDVVVDKRINGSRKCSVSNRLMTD